MHPMTQILVAVPGLYIFVFGTALTVMIAVLVVLPAIWSNRSSRRRAAYQVLDRILKFFRPCD
jgi:hypothetical protein